MNLEIAPYRGVGPLFFGMAPEEVHAIAGEPRRVRPQRNGLVELYAFGGRCVFEKRSDKPELVEMGFLPSCAELSYTGLRLFGVPPREALRRLLQHDPDVYESLGFLIFLKLGITLTGFHDEADDLAVTVFERGRWSDQDMRPWKQGL